MLKRIGLAVSVVILSIGQSFSANIEPTQTGKTPSASKVVERFIEAVGGRSAWLKITSQFAAGHLEVLGGGRTEMYEVYTKPPNQSLVVMRRSSRGEIKMGFDANEPGIKLSNMKRSMMHRKNRRPANAILIFLNT